MTVDKSLHLSVPLSLLLQSRGWSCPTWEEGILGNYANSSHFILRRMWGLGLAWEFLSASSAGGGGRGSNCTPTAREAGCVLSREPQQPPPPEDLELSGRMLSNVIGFLERRHGQKRPWITPRAGTRRGTHQQWAWVDCPCLGTLQGLWTSREPSDVPSKKKSSGWKQTLQNWVLFVFVSHCYCNELPQTQRLTILSSSAGQKPKWVSLG